MTNYDSFAPYYDQVVGERHDVALFLRALLLRHHRSAATILEFGCGSGSMLKVLSSHYETTGIDNSRKMLTRARAKAPQARIVHGDITTIDLKQKFDAVLCPFDTINHITSKALWRKVFANAARHLAPAGVFIFDINTPFKMERYCNEPITADVTEEQISLVEVQKKGKEKYEITARLLKQQRGTTYKLHTMKLTERIIHPKKVLEEISQHFRTITLIDPDRRYPSEETEELYFVCRNPF